jgi:hypothetical protein
MTTAPEDYGTDSMSQVGPLGGLQAGVIAGVTGQTIDPIQAEIDRIKAAREPGMGKLTAEQIANGPTVKTTPRKKLKYTYTDEKTGDLIDVFEDDTEEIRTKGTKIADAKTAANALAAERIAGRLSAYDILYREFKANGLESLVSDAKDIILNEETEAGRLLALRNSPAYKTRFSANAKRVANGFKAIDEATYLGLEDRYQQIAQNYGLPAKYYARGELGVQQYFDDAISKNIDPVTFEERIVEGQKIVNANKATFDAAKQFYPTLTDGDFLDYVLNPTNAIEDIKRKVAAAEIGGAAIQSGLTANLARAEELQKMGVDKASAVEGYSAIGGGLQRGSELASIYGESPYTQATAESEIFKLTGQDAARKQRQKVTGLEKAAFGGQSGVTSGALARDRAGGY